MACLSWEKGLAAAQWQLGCHGTCAIEHVQGPVQSKPLLCGSPNPNWGRWVWYDHQSFIFPSYSSVAFAPPAGPAAP